ncbi:hypothetical protein ACFVT5_39575 [Streptomyces sp. NPDC058001]|uniref:hypothetical protein n=1 Tax=Streptomyces sp. NPDC058001 TaxID=3346300 RepID=UPI0036E3FBEF
MRQADEPAGRGTRGGHALESRDEELARLRAVNNRLGKAGKEWEPERENLRRAAQYFAAEMKASPVAGTSSAPTAPTSA